MKSRHWLVLLMVCMLIFVSACSSDNGATAEGKPDRITFSTGTTSGVSVSYTHLTLPTKA